MAYESGTLPRCSAGSSAKSRMPTKSIRCANPGAPQAGARRYPEPPTPRHHRAKPGAESTLHPAPMYQAPYYRGSGKLAGKVALITGADSGIGRAVAML